MNLEPIKKRSGQFGTHLLTDVRALVAEVESLTVQRDTARMRSMDWEEWGAMHEARGRTMLRQLSEARSLLPLLAERSDEHTYDEFATVLNDGPTDDDGNDLIAAYVEESQDVGNDSEGVRS